MCLKEEGNEFNPVMLRKPLMFSSINFISSKSVKITIECEVIFMDIEETSL